MGTRKTYAVYQSPKIGKSSAPNGLIATQRSKAAFVPEGAFVMGYTNRKQATNLTPERKAQWPVFNPRVTATEKGPFARPVIALGP